jgi:hypothetical protein
MEIFTICGIARQKNEKAAPTDTAFPQQLTKYDAFIPATAP